MITTNPKGGKLAYRMGGICGLVLGIGYLIIIVLYVPIGAPPTPVEQRLLYLAANAQRWWWIIGLSVFTDFLFVPLAFSIYLALHDINRYLILLAAACIILFAVLDLTITWTNYSSLMELSAEYTRAGSGVQRASVLAEAAGACATLQSRLLFVYNTLTLAAGILLAGVVMLRREARNASAYLGVATGGVGVIAVLASFFTSALSGAIIIASILTTVWVIVIGWKLYTFDI